MDLVTIVLFLSILATFQFLKSRMPSYILLCILYSYYSTTSPPLSEQEAFGLFIPSILLHFYFSRPWTHFAAFQFFLALLLWKFNNCELWVLSFGPLFTVIIFICFSLDFENLQFIHSFYRKSDLLFQNLWDKSHFITFIIDKNAVVLKKNQAGEELVLSKTVKSENSKELNLDQIIKLQNFESFIAKIFKGEEVEEELFKHSHQEKLESITDKGLCHLIRGEKVKWCGGNCAAIYLTDISLIRGRRMMMIECIRMAQLNAGNFMKNLESMKNEIDAEIINGFFNLSQLLRDAMVLKSRFFCRYEPRYEHFDVNAEVMNAIEVLYLKACSTNVSVNYTKDQGVPNSVIGDKVLHFQVIYSMLNFIFEICIPGTEVLVFLQVYSLVKYDITLIYKFSFKSEKISSLNVENMFHTQNYNCSKEFIHQLSGLLNTYGLGIAAVNNILLFLRGGIVQVHSESEPNKVTINLTLPFNTGIKKVNNPKLKISPDTIQDSKLTTKWRPSPQKPLRRSKSINNNPKTSEELKKFSIFSGSQIQIFAQYKEKIKEIWTKEEILAEADRDSDIKKTLLIISKSPEFVKDFFSDSFLVQVCKDVPAAKQVFLRFFECQAQFSAVLVEEVNQDIQLFKEFVEKTEENCYLKTPLYYFRGFYEGNTQQQ